MTPTPLPEPIRSDAEAFHQAIEATPYDRTLWITFAEWLRDHDAPRSEFMQVQLALEDEGRSKAERDELKKREQVLLAQHERDWLGPLAPFVLDQPPIYTWNPNLKCGGATVPPILHTFSRGWLTALHCHRLSVNAIRALAHSSEARHLRTLLVDHCANELPVGSVEVEYPKEFYEPGPDVPEGLPWYLGPSLHALTHVPQLKNLRTFRLGQPIDEETDEGFRYQLQCHMNGALSYALVKQIPHLEELHLYAHTNEQMDELLALPLPNLRELVLYHGRNYPLEALASNPSLTKLTHLSCHPHAVQDISTDYCRAYIQLAHISAICWSPHLRSLTHLRLKLADFGDAGVYEIVNSGLLKRLQLLDLRHGAITDEGAVRLATSPDVKHLDHLLLSNNAITSVGIEALKRTGVKLDAEHMHGGAPEEYLFQGDIE